MTLSVFLYAFYLPINLVFILLAYLLSPFLSALSLITGPKLPGVLQWFSTLDDDLDGGVHQNVAGYKDGLKGFGLWWQRTCWICRNPAHGFQAELLGFPAEGTVIVRQWLQDEPKQQFYIMETLKGFRFFCFKRDQPLVAGFYLKVWLGWVNKAYDGKNHHYAFQLGLKRKD